MRYLLPSLLPCFFTLFLGCVCNAQTVEDVLASESNWLGISSFDFANFLNAQQVDDEGLDAIRSEHIELYEAADRELVRLRQKGEISAKEFIELEERNFVNFANQNAMFFSEDELEQFVLTACRDMIQAVSRIGDPSNVGCFEHEKVAAVLKLTRDQRDLIEQSRTDLTTDLKLLTKKRTDTLQDLLNEHFKACREILDSPQKDLFDDLHGSPINWPMLSQRLVYSMEHPYVSKAGAISKIEVSRKEDDSSAEFPEAIAKETFLVLTSSVFLGDQVLSGIELTDAQEKELKGHVASLQRFTKSSDSESDVRLEQLLEGKADLPDPFESVLVGHQKPWIKQLEFQIFMFKERRSFGLLNSSFKKVLKLTAEQTQKVVKEKKEFVKKLSLAIPNIEKEEVAARQKTFDNIYGSLTNNQKVIYDRLIGAPQFKN